jgi:hypothetical protein
VNAAGEHPSALSPVRRTTVRSPMPSSEAPLALIASTGVPPTVIVAPGKPSALSTADTEITPSPVPGEPVRYGL